MQGSVGKSGESSGRPPRHGLASHPQSILGSWRRGGWGVSNNRSIEILSRDSNRFRNANASAQAQ